MVDHKRVQPSCPTHGKPTKRDTCPSCNAAYMKEYMRQQRLDRPAIPLWERARRRARQRGVPFTLPRSDVAVPDTCPVLGIPLLTGRQRSANSPSLDRIVPSRGYVAGNVRVISDRANRIKGDRDLGQLRTRALSGPVSLRNDYEKIADYVDRESLLDEVRTKAAAGGRLGDEWAKVALFLERAFTKGPAF